MASPASVADSEASREARELLVGFRSAYSSGDIEQLRPLLTSRRGWRNDRGRVLRRYSQLFEQTATRRIDLEHPLWLRRGDKPVLLASYQAWTRPSGHARAQRSAGVIRFDLRREDGRLRILRIRHEGAE